MASLCHPWFTTTNFSYRFPIFETSATALCGTTGIQLYLYMDIGISILNHDSRSAIDIDNQHSYVVSWMIQNHSLQKKGQKMETRMRGKIANIWFYNLPCDSKSREIGDADWYSILSQVWNQNPSIPSLSSAGMWFQHVSTPQKHMNHSDHPKPFLGMANYKTKPGCFSSTKRLFI